MRGLGRRCSGVGLPDAEVDHDLRVELGDDPVNLGFVEGIDPMEIGRTETTARRVHIDAAELADPGRAFEERCYL